MYLIYETGEDDSKKDYHVLRCGENTWWRFKRTVVEMRLTQGKALKALLDMYDNARDSYSPHIAGERRY